MLFTLAMILDELAGLDPVCNHKTQKDVEIQGFSAMRRGRRVSPEQYICLFQRRTEKLG